MRTLEGDLEAYFQACATRYGDMPQPLVDWHEVDRRQRRPRRRRLLLALSSIAAAAAIAVAFVLLFARDRSARVERLQGWLLAGSGRSLEALSQTDRLGAATRVVALSDTIALLEAPATGARFEIDGRADLEITPGGVALREGSIRGEQNAHVEVPALAVSADGDDFRISLDAEGCTVRAGERAVRIVVAGGAGAFDQTVAAGHCVKISPGCQPWLEKDSSNVCEELPTVSPFPIALRDAEVGSGTSTNPSVRRRHAAELLADSIHSTASTVRRRAVEAIGLIPVDSLGDEALLIAGQADEVPAVRVAAVDSAVRAHAHDAVAKLSLLLESPKTTLDVRIAAARALGRVESTPATEAALRALATRPTRQTPASDVADVASVYDALLNDLQSGADADKSVGLAMLARTSGTPDGLPEAVRAFESRFRIAAIRLALVAGGEDVTPALVEFLDDPDPRVAAEAVLVLGLRHEATPRASDDSVPPEIVGAMQRRPNDSAFQARAVYALGLFADSTTLPSVLAAASSDDPVKRRHAAFGIGNVLTDRADSLDASATAAGRDALKKLLVDPDDGVRNEAVSALRRVLHSSPGDAAIAFVPRLDDASEIVRHGAALALLSAPSEEAAEPLLRRFENTDETSSMVRAACAQAYGACGRSAASAALRRALPQADAIVARGILLGLRSAFDGTGEDDILALLDSPDAGICVATIECLRSVRAKLSSRDATLRRIALLVTSPSTTVRQAAIGFLSSWGPSTPMEIETWILPALRDLNPAVQLEAAIALSRAGRPEGPEYIVKRLSSPDPNAKPAESRADRIRVLSAIRDLASPLPTAIARAAEELETRGSLDDEATVAALLQLAIGFDRPASDALLEAAGRSRNPWIQIGGTCALARRTQDRSLISNALDRPGRPRDLVRALADLPQQDRDDLRDGTVTDAVIHAIEYAFTQWPADTILHVDSSKQQLRFDEVSRFVALRATVLASLAEIASDSRPEARTIGTRALGAFSSRVAQRLTIKRLEDPDIDVREAARLSLVESVGQDFGFSPLGNDAGARSIVDGIRAHLLDRAPEFGDRAEILIGRLVKKLTLAR
ncbi:MAG: HEAT repeat domain-containing protein [Planctomycetes bacterium]|nr:HEAT repeat domain-containing protein [Planctomycetota bacterium]MBI3843491.1 HEAT repeat domain-containing protein [Planctomycetota bacterium]